MNDERKKNNLFDEWWKKKKTICFKVNCEEQKKSERGKRKSVVSYGSQSRKADPHFKIHAKTLT